jgi:DNA polymerase V
MELKEYKEKSQGNVSKIWLSDPSESIALPLFSHTAPAGFPSPADDHIEERLDLNKYLIKHPAATFFVKVDGDSMINSGIHNGDILVVDRSLEARDGMVIVAALNGELTVKRLKKKNNKIWLYAEHPDYKPIEITEGIDFMVWGVVTNSIHKV